MSSNNEFERACQELNQGNAVAAQEIMQKAVDAAQAQFGNKNSEYAQNLFHLACIYLAMEDLKQATQNLEAAIGATPDNTEGQQQRMTYMMNLGEILIQDGRFEPAETVLRKSLAEREEFYGQQNPGYAFGVRPLAEALWLQGKDAEAKELIDKAVEILMNNGSPEVVSAVAVRAFIYASQESEQPLFPMIQGLPEELVDQLIQNVLELSFRPSPEFSLIVLNHLIHWTSYVRGMNHPSLLTIWGAVAEFARQGRAYDLQQQALHQAMKIALHHKDAERMILIEKTLAMSQSEAQMAEAEATFKSALAKAEKFGKAEITSSVLRDYGLYLAEIERRSEAEPLLRKSLVEAEKGKDPQTKGDALTALGLFLQHGEAFDEAKILLEEAISIVHPASPTRFYAESHLKSLLNNQPCSCKLNKQISQTIKEKVLPQIPENLLQEISYDADTRNLNIQLFRDPSFEEQELLNKVINQAIKEVVENVKVNGAATS